MTKKMIDRCSAVIFIKFEANFFFTLTTAGKPLFIRRVFHLSNF